MDAAASLARILLACAMRGSPFQVEAGPLLLQLLAPGRRAHQLLLQFRLKRFCILVAGLKDAACKLSGL
jgi:hypothetical protein